MITIISKKFKSFSQKKYNSLVNTLDFHRLACTCGRKGDLIKHGHYSRSIKTPQGFVALSILRVACKSCHRTHAILSSAIVPYSQVSLNDHIKIIQALNRQESFESIMLANLLIDESNIRSIIRQYRIHWKERLASFSVILDLSITRSCFEHYSRQFMQIKCTANCLFS